MNTSHRVYQMIRSLWEVYKLQEMSQINQKRWRTRKGEKPTAPRWRSSPPGRPGTTCDASRHLQSLHPTAPRPPPFDPRRFRLETWLEAAILVRGESAALLSGGSRSGAAGPPLPPTPALAAVEPERVGAPHHRRHHGKTRAGLNSRVRPCSTVLPAAGLCWG